MTPPAASERSTQHRFPGKSISHGGWRYAGARQSLCVSGVTKPSHESQLP